MSRRSLDFGRALFLWIASFGMYFWLGGPLLQFIWWLLSAMLLNGILLALLGPRRMEMKQSFSPACLYAGENVDIDMTLTFKSRMPLPWISITQQLGGETVRKLWFPGFRRSVHCRVRLECPNRGEWPEVITSVEWGDMFGWFRFEELVRSTAGLTVTPRPLSLHGTPDAVSTGTGERYAPPFYISLPGFLSRDYVTGDPLNRIHWKNSARFGKLQTFVPHNGKGGERCIVLDISSGGYPGTDQHETRGRFEHAVSAAAGLVYASAVTHTRSALWMIGPGCPPLEVMSPADEGEHLLLKPLAGVSLKPGNLTAAETMEALFKASENMTGKAELFILTGSLSAEMADAAVHAILAGCRVSVICTEQLADPADSGRALGAQPARVVSGAGAESLLGAGGRLFQIAGSAISEITGIVGGEETHGEPPGNKKRIR